MNGGVLLGANKKLCSHWALKTLKVFLKQNEKSLH